VPAGKSDSMQVGGHHKCKRLMLLGTLPATLSVFLGHFLYTQEASHRRACIDILAGAGMLGQPTHQVPVKVPILVHSLRP